MRRQTILFDMDGCKVDFTGGILKFLLDHHPHATLQREDLHIWDFFSLIPCELARREAEEVMRSPGFFFNLEPIPEALTAYRALVESGHNVRICTTPVARDWPAARMRSMRDKTKWVEKYLGRQAAKKIIFSDDKTEVPADVIIDDKPHLTVGKTMIRFQHWVIVDHTYNRNLPDAHHLPISRINTDWSNWREEFAKLELI